MTRSHDHMTRSQGQSCNSRSHDYLTIHIVQINELSFPHVDLLLEPVLPYTTTALGLAAHSQPIQQEHMALSLLGL